jgi:hypothetical protein
VPSQLFREAGGLCRDSSPPRQLPNAEVSRHDHDYGNDANEVEDSSGHITSSSAPWFRGISLVLEQIDDACKIGSTDSAGIYLGFGRPDQGCEGVEEPAPGARAPFPSEE